MNIKRINYLGLLFILIVSGLLFAVGFKRANFNSAQKVYQVYLDGEKIGILKNEDELLNLIDKKQDAIKNQFGVERVYPPSGLVTTEYITYNNNLKSAKKIYDIIESKSTFTILGYKVYLKSNNGEVKTINILNKEDLEPALMDAVSAFINIENINNYLNDTQVEIVDTGKIIESIYFDEKITIKEDYIPVNEMIITNKSDLTKYLLFGTLEKQDEYIVKSGDTVESVAYNNKLSNEELLIANPNLSSINTLLSTGQVLNIGLINPLFTIIEESKVVADVEKAFDTVYEKDPNRYASQSYVKQQGSNGVNRITQRIQYKNGEITNLVVEGTPEMITPPINKIIVKGTKVAQDYNFNYYPPAASATDWGWPTISPYMITSYYGYRWGRLHGGIDISGSGFGSPIYSATDGIVTSTYSGCANNGYYGSTCGNSFGNHIEVRTPTGLTIVYAHIKNNITVSVGQTITKGQHIGYLGNSGSSTGPHLHFEIRDGNGTRLNPCKVAFKC